MYNEWHDIDDINSFMDYYEFNNYVVFVGADEDGAYMDLAFGIDLFPKGVTRFFCVPNDDKE